MRSICIKLPLLTLFSLTALSCPKEIPSRSAMPARRLHPAGMPPARPFLIHAEITRNNTPTIPIDGIIELY